MEYVYEGLVKSTRRIGAIWVDFFWLDAPKVRCAAGKLQWGADRATLVVAAASRTLPRPLKRLREHPGPLGRPFPRYMHSGPKSALNGSATVSVAHEIKGIHPFSGAYCPRIASGLGKVGPAALPLPHSKPFDAVVRLNLTGLALSTF